MLAAGALSCLLLLPGTAGAQRPEAFSRIALSGGRVSETGERTLDPFWSAEPGATAFLTTPFYRGDLELGISAGQFTAVSPEQPDFDAAIAYAGWSATLRLFDRLIVSAGPRVGMHLMAFDVETFSGVRNEAEVAIGGHTRLSLYATPWLGVFVGGAYMKTLTHVPMEQIRASGGLTLSFKTPKWLVQVLR